jgi:HEAT repeat protein
MSDPTDDAPALGGSDSPSMDVQLSGSDIIARALAKIEETHPDIAANLRHHLGTQGSRVPLVQAVRDVFGRMLHGDIRYSALKILREVGKANPDPAFRQQIVEIIDPFNGPHDGHSMDMIAHAFADIGIDVVALLREGFARGGHDYWVAAHFLREIDDPAVIVEALSHPEAEARKWALMHIGRAKDSSLILNRYIEIIRSDPDLNLRVTAAYRVPRTPAAIPALREQLHQTEFHWVHGPVIEALVALKDKESIPGILTAMRLAAERLSVPQGRLVDSEYAILNRGFHAIADFGDATCLPIALETVSAPVAERRIDAIHALQKLAERDPLLLPQVIPAIASLLKDKQRGYGYDEGLGTPVKDYARDALQEIGTHEALAVLAPKRTRRKKSEESTRKDS